MMTNLFSMFDPLSMFLFPMNWLSILLGMILIPNLFWILPSRYNYIWKQINFKLYSEFKILLNTTHKNNILMFISLFYIIMFNNFLGMFPYIFTSTSHMVMTLSLAFPLWLSFMIYGWYKNTQHMFIHLIPQGTPYLLMLFMVCIEMISNLIRPGTLAIRLSANMIAGHLLMSLLGNTGSSLMNYLIILLLITQIMLMLLESAVAIIQAYVFTVLSILYSNEVI